MGDHLGFGYGTHRCAGEGLARMEALAALGALARRVRGFAVSDGQRRISNTTHGYATLPVVDIQPA